MPDDREDEYIMNTERNRWRTQAMTNKACLAIVPVLLFLARPAQASGYNWTGGTIAAIAHNTDGTLGISLNATSWSPNSLPAGETSTKPCQVEGQTYANFYVIEAANPNRSQFLAELMATWLSGKTVYLDPQSGSCFATSSLWVAPLADRIDLSN